MMIDADGLTLTLTLGPLDPIPAMRDPEFVLACHRTHNDWIAEAQRAVGELGLDAVFIRSAPYHEDVPFSRRLYDPFWVACAELGVPVGLHPATHTDVHNAARKFGLIRQSADMAVTNKVADEVTGGTAMSIAIGAPVDAIVSLGRLILGGVCERFPGLKLVVLESGGGWAASILDRMDDEIEANPREAAWLAMRPSEHFCRQCWISFEPDDPILPRVADLIGEDRILWASDCPHSDAVYPGTVEALETSIAPLCEDVKAAVRGGNAVEAHGLQVSERSR